MKKFWIWILCSFVCIAAEADVVFGPKDYVRTAGQPIETIENFAVELPGGDFTLRIDNGGTNGQYDRVTDATLQLNGVQLLDAEDFGKDVAIIERTISLSNSNELRIKLKGKPGSGFTLQISSPTSNDTQPPDIVINGVADGEFRNTDATITIDISDPSGVAEQTITLDGNPFTSGSTVSAEGDHALSVYARDTIGNETTVQVSFTIDKTPPTISFTVSPEPNASGWNTSDVTVSFEGNDSLSGIGEITQPVIVSAEGSNQHIIGTAVDRAGNESSTTVTIHLDKSQPSILRINSPAPGSSVNATSLTIIGLAIDVVSGVGSVDCNGNSGSIGGSGFSCTVPLAEGSNNVTVTATDRAGFSSSTNATYVVDLDPPSIDISGVTEGQITSSDLTIVFSANDTDTISATLSKDGGSAEPFSSGSVVQETGVYLLSVQASDQAGNSVKAVRNFEIDKAGPVLSIDSPVNGFITNIANVFLTGTVADRNQISQVTVNGINVSVTDGRFTNPSLLLSHRGANTIYIEAKDGLNNTSNLNLTVTLDTEGPIISGITPNPGSGINSLIFDLSGNVSDVSGIDSILVRGIPAVVTQNLFTRRIEFTTEGDKTVEIHAVDVAGNTTALTVDYRVFSGVEAPLINPLPKATNQNPITISGQANPGTQIKISGGAAEVLVNTDSSGNFSTSYLLLENQTNSLTVVAVNGGLESFPQSFEVKHDNVAPAAPLLLNYASDVPTTNISLIGITEPTSHVFLNGLASELTTTSAENGLFGFQIQIGENATETINIYSVDEARNSGAATTVQIHHDPTLVQIGHLAISESRNWRAPAGTLFPFPLEVILTDDLGEPIQNYPLEFSVVAGGGLVEGQQSITKQTNSIGRASVLFQLGNEIGEGNNIVRVTFANNVEPPVTFLITGLEPKVGPAVVKGVVLDENFRAIPNATITLMRDGAQNIVVLTDSKGDFRFNNVEPGRYHLRADGTTTNLPLQRYPVLVYEIDVFEGQENTIGMPIFLPRTQIENNLDIDGVTNQTYATPAIPGLKVDIAPGVITYPDGSHSGEFIISPVPINVLPMPLPNGWATRLAISIQPAGTEFNPPLPITFPNIDGLPPGSKAAIVSFDHGEGRYIKVGDATVSQDGTEIVSDPGHGIHFGAWHAMVPPKKPPCTNVKCDIVSPGSGSCNLIAIGSSTTVQVPGTCLTACIAFPPNGKASASALCEIQNDDELGDPELEVFGQEEISADDGLVYVVAHAFFPSEEDPENPEPVGDGSIIEWTIVQGNGTLSQTQTPTTDGVAVVALVTSRTAGSTYVVQSKLTSYIKDGATKSANLTAATELMTVVSGLPADIEIDQSKSSYQSDGTDTVDFEATIKDAFGNLVADDTAVAWLLDESTTGFLESQTTTANGKVTAQLISPLLPVNQVVTVNALTAIKQVSVDVNSVDGTITAPQSILDISTEEIVVLTASVNAADETEVIWTTSNGSITSTSKVFGGEADATLSSAGGRLGLVTVTATIGDRLLIWQGEFTSSTGVAIGFDHPVIIADRSENGFVTVVWEDGTQRQIPYFASTAVQVKGPANSIALISTAQELPIEFYSLDSINGDEIVGNISGHVMTVNGAHLDDGILHSGTASLFFEDSEATASIGDSSDFDFYTNMSISFWLRPDTLTDANLISKANAWAIKISNNGNITATVETTGGIQTITTTNGLTSGRWSKISLDASVSELRLSLDGEMFTLPISGTLVSNNDSIIFGTGFTGHIDDLLFSSPLAFNPYLEFSGLAADRSLQLDGQGSGVFYIRSLGTATADVEINISVRVGLGSEILFGGPEEAFKWLYAAKFISMKLEPIWVQVYDVVQSFVGGDPETIAGIVASIVGGYLVVGDVGAVIKNLARVIGWDEKDPNVFETSLALVGILSTFSGPGDAVVTSCRAIVARIGNTAFSKVLLIRRVKAIVGFGEAVLSGEEAFIRAIRNSDELQQVFNAVIHNDEIYQAAVKGADKLGETFYDAVKIALAESPTAARKIAKILGELPDDVLQTLKTSEKFVDSVSALAKVLNKGIDPEALKIVLTNDNIFNPAYTQAKLLLDLGELAEVKGLDKLVDLLGYGNRAGELKDFRQARGFRYELEVASFLKRQGFEVVELSKKVEVVIEEFGPVVKTDIDVIIKDGEKLIYVQAKNGPDAFGFGKGGLEDTQVWVQKALKDLPGGKYDQIMYVTPDPSKIPPQIQKWFQELFNEGKQISIIPVPHI